MSRAGLTSTLSSPGQTFTVFAPTNSAFSELDTETRQRILSNNAELADVLKYHVLPSKVLSSDLQNELLVSTVEGSPLRINVYPNNVFTAQCSPIDITNIDKVATNGIVHVLDKVMIPPQGDVIDLVTNDVRLTTLLGAIEAAGLKSTFAGPGPFTVFAPTNEAFANVDQNVLSTILENPNILESVLKYHVLAGTQCSAGLVTSSFKTLNGGDVQVVVEGTDVEVNGAEVVSADVSVSNGVVHLIDTLLIPPGLNIPGKILDRTDH